VKDKRTRGFLAESYAQKLLERNGYTIIDRNFSSRFGEIDIIATDVDEKSKEKVLVFVEVKARWSRKYGKPEEAVIPSKLKKIIKTSEYYCLTHKNLPRKKRIDVVALEIERGSVVRSKIIRV
jgi:putative endonuclease